MDDEIITIKRKALMTAAHDAAAHMETFVLNVDTLKEQQHKHPVHGIIEREYTAEQVDAATVDGVFYESKVTPTQNTEEK